MSDFPGILCLPRGAQVTTAGPSTSSHHRRKLVGVVDCAMRDSIGRCASSWATAILTRRGSHASDYSERISRGAQYCKFDSTSAACALLPAPEHHPAGEIVAESTSSKGTGGRPMRRASVGSTCLNSPRRLARKMPRVMLAHTSGMPRATRPA